MSGKPDRVTNLRPMARARRSRRWRAVREWLRPSWRMFISALPLLGFWLLLPGVVFVLSAGHRAGMSVRERADQAIVESTSVFSDTQGALTLTLAHPQSIRLNTSGESATPLAIWLIRGSTSTSILPPSSTPYAIRLEVAGDILDLVDEDGIPTPSEVVLTPTVQGTSPAVLYIRPARAATLFLPSRVEAKAYLDDFSTTPLTTSFRLESTVCAWARRLGEIAGETTIFVGTLIGPL